MSSPDFLKQTLEYYRQQRQKRIDELRTLETSIRQLEQDLGEPTVIANGADLPAGLDPLAERSGFNDQKLEIRPDEFFQKSHSEAARMYLMKIGHAVSWDELVEALRKGGCKLRGADPKRTLYISLIRNARDFTLPQSGYIGLRSFYGMAAKARPVPQSKNLKRAAKRSPKQERAKRVPPEVQGRGATENSAKPGRTGEVKTAVKNLMEDRLLRDSDIVQKAVEEKLGHSVTKLSILSSLRSKEYEQVGEQYRFRG